MLTAETAAALPTLASIRTRLAELEARAAARRAQDAARAADIAPTSVAEPTELDTLREDAQLADAAARATRPARRPRPDVAPEYAHESSGVATLAPENRTDPATEAGGNADVPAAREHEDSRGAATVPEAGHRPAIGSGTFHTRAGRGAKSPAPISELRDGPPPPAAVPAASEPTTGEGAKCPLPGSEAATHGIRKLPQDAAVGDWRTRWARIEATVMVCRLAPPAAWAGPIGGLAPVQPDPRPAARSARGPPSM